MPAGADSAGVPWAGRRFQPNASAADDGSAPEQLHRALEGFRSGEAGESAVAAAVRSCRLLVPLVAELGETDTDAHGRTVDKSQELSLVTVAGPDGRSVLPAFTSVAEMGRWNPSARPIPVDGRRVAVASAAEGTDLVVLDPASAPFVLRRPALRAIAEDRDWTPSYADPSVAGEFRRLCAVEPAVARVTLAAGDPRGDLTGPELLVGLDLAPGLDRAALDALLARLRESWSRSEVIAERVDSMRLRLGRAA